MICFFVTTPNCSVSFITFVYVVDIVFEAGAALIGAGITAYFMGVLLNNQQAKTKRWRKRLREAIARRTRELE
jgi:hypothetical protein